jgi:hypothetical protein
MEILPPAVRDPSREFQARWLPEPDLVFGSGFRCPDPKAGLALHGPFDRDDSARPERIRLGVIGTGHTIDLFRQWVERCQREVRPLKLVRTVDGNREKPVDPILHAPFPGIRDVFAVEVSLSDSLCEVLQPAEVAAVERIPLFEPRVTRLVDIVVERVRLLGEKSSRPDVVVCALPTSLRLACTHPTLHQRRSKSHRTLGERIRATLQADASVGQKNLFDLAALHGIDLETVEEEREVVVFHSGLKARAMEVGTPTQLIWEGTLDGSAFVEDAATRAWNFWTGVYYKAGGIPWRVTGLENGTCYVGVSIYRGREQGTFHSAVAQAFSDRGEGLVIRSDPFQAPQDRMGNPHLTGELAAGLTRRVVEAFRQHRDHLPARVVVHKWQRYWEEERRGFEEAFASVGIARHDLVALGSRGLRFFRTGTEPPLRGMSVVTGPNNALLYTRGYIPYLERYPGLRVPRPIELTEHYGSAPLDQLCREILALTKMDWNSANFAAKAPITTEFAADVGHILVEVPTAATPQQSYRFYM